MVENFIELANAVLAFIIPSALKTVGKKLGESTLSKFQKSFDSIYCVIQEKLKLSGSSNLLDRAKENPTELNISTLKTELINLMNEDQAFVKTLTTLVGEIYEQTPAIQSILDEAWVSGDAEVGNISQNSKADSGQQIIGRSLIVGGNLKIGNISQNRNQ